MKKNVKYLLIGFIAIIAVVALFINSNKAFAIATEEIKLQKAELFFTEKGIVENEEEINIFPLVSGEVLEIYVNENDEIAVGQPICKIDTTNIGFEISQAQAQIKSLEAQKRNLTTDEIRQKDNLTTSKNTLLKELETINVQEDGVTTTKAEQIRLQNILISQNEADIVRAKDDLEKFTILNGAGIISTNELENSQKALELYETQYNQNKQQLEVIEAGGNGQSSKAYFEATKNSLLEQVKGIDSSLAKSYTGSMQDYYTAQIELTSISIEKLNKLKADANIVSTVAGVITKLPIKDTNIASSGVPIATVGTGNSLIKTYVSTKDINSLEENKVVDIILKRREGDETFKGKIYKIDNKAEVKISSLGVEERKIKVLIEPTESKELFKNGFDTDVKFLAYEKDSSVLVPKTAIFKDGEKYMVWEVVDKALVKTEVVKGIELRSEVVINEGLNESDLVVKDSSIEELKVGLKVESE